jgi:hypothetical protein
MVMFIFVVLKVVVKIVVVGLYGADRICSPVHNEMKIRGITSLAF